MRASEIKGKVDKQDYISLKTYCTASEKKITE
jgi:hypothetical protein